MESPLSQSAKIVSVFIIVEERKDVKLLLASRNGLLTSLFPNHIISLTFTGRGKQIKTGVKPACKTVFPNRVKA
jgi:hypothetical protein